MRPFGAYRLIRGLVAIVAGIVVIAAGPHFRASIWIGVLLILTGIVRVVWAGRQSLR